MAANETAEAALRSVTDLGRRVGLSAQEFNVALNLAGILRGEPGAWGLTERGTVRRRALPRQRLRGLRPPGVEYDEVVGVGHGRARPSDAGIRQVRQVIADRKLAQKAVREAGTVAAEAAFLRSEAAKHTANAVLRLSNQTRTRVLLGVGAVATAYGLGKAVPLVRRRRQQRANASEQRSDGPSET